MIRTNEILEMNELMNASRMHGMYESRHARTNERMNKQTSKINKHFQKNWDLVLHCSNKTNKEYKCGLKKIMMGVGRKVGG